MVFGSDLLFVFTSWPTEHSSPPSVLLQKEGHCLWTQVWLLGALQLLPQLLHHPEGAEKSDEQRITPSSSQQPAQAQEDEENPPPPPPALHPPSIPAFTGRMYLLLTPPSGSTFSFSPLGLCGVWPRPGRRPDLRRAGPRQERTGLQEEAELVEEAGLQEVEPDLTER